MCDRRCLPTACDGFYCSSSSFFELRRRACEKNRVLQRERVGLRMPPARAAPRWSPSRAVLAGRDAPARVRARGAPRRAPRRSSRPRWAASAAQRAVGRRTTPTQLKSVTGQPQGQPQPTSVARGAPARALPARGRPATSPPSLRPRQGRGAHMYRGNYSYSNAALQRGGAKAAPSASRSCPTGPNTSAASRRRRAAAHIAKTGSPSGAPGSNSPGGAGGGRAPHANETPSGAPA